MFNMVPVNLEIYPSITQKKNYWKRPFWLTTGSNMGGRYNFYNYATAAFSSGRYTTARGLLRSAPARKAFLKHQIAK